MSKTVCVFSQPLSGLHVTLSSTSIPKESKEKEVLEEDFSFFLQTDREKKRSDM